MFYDCVSLREVVLGPGWSFGYSSLRTLPTPPTTDGYTGKWINSSVENATAVTPAILRSVYSGTDAGGQYGPGTYVWDELESASLTLDLNGGMAPDGVTYPSVYYLTRALRLPGTDGATLPAPIKYGYDFAGWTDAASDSQETVTEIPADSTGDRAFTATWTATQLEFTVPSVIAYVVQSDGTLTGPSNAYVENETQWPIQVSKLQATAADGFHIVADVTATSPTEPNAVDLSIGPAEHQVSLADYLTEAAVPTPGDWQMGEKTATESERRLALVTEGHAARLTADVTSSTPFATLKWTVGLVLAA